MSTLFSIEGAGAWGPTALGGHRRWRLTARAGGVAALPEDRAGNGAARDDAPLLVRGGTAAWALLAPAGAGIAVNGVALRCGIRVLAGRDAIRLAAGEPAYFSTERLAEVVPFQGSGVPVHCARCTGPIAPGEPVVACPGCGVPQHQVEGGEHPRPCWTYDDTCAACGIYETRLDAGYRWSPEVL